MKDLNLNRKIYSKQKMITIKMNVKPITQQEFIQKIKFNNKEEVKESWVNQILEKPLLNNTAKSTGYNIF